MGNGCVELHSPAGKRQQDQASDVVGLVHDVVAVKRRRIRLKRSRRPEDAPEPPKPSPKTPKEILEGVDVALQRQLWNRCRDQWVCRYIRERPEPWRPSTSYEKKKGLACESWSKLSPDQRAKEFMTWVARTPAQPQEKEESDEAAPRRSFRNGHLLTWHLHDCHVDFAAVASYTQIVRPTAKWNASLNP